MGTFGATHYQLRPDLERLAEAVARRFGVYWCTYEDHPPGLNLDAVSVDFWGPGGRGDKLSPRKMRKIARYLRARPGAPYWRWIIRGRVGYYPDGSRFRPPGGALWNAGHVHLTVW